MKSEFTQPEFDSRGIKKENPEYGLIGKTWESVYGVSTVNIGRQGDQNHVGTFVVAEPKEGSMRYPSTNARSYIGNFEVTDIELYLEPATEFPDKYVTIAAKSDMVYAAPENTYQTLFSVLDSTEKTMHDREERRELEIKYKQKPYEKDAPEDTDRAA
jgi:hypothetical protein